MENGEVFLCQAATFNEAENVENQRSSKILKAAPAQWLSHCEA